ncbi:Imm48 family immunity protein [Brevibacillus laterosporus]|uniref:Imm48 family immunity protein n=1 Tax=Brevibacillus laterosporus TaxID=1465 RepID=UPI003D226AB3
MEKCSYRIKSFIKKSLDLITIKFEETTELENQVIAAFCFGAINVIVQRDDLSQPQAHALTITVFKYSENQAVSFADDLIKATSKEHYPVMNTIIHRGIDGHYQYINNMDVELKKNIAIKKNA